MNFQCLLLAACVLLHYVIGTYAAFFCEFDSEISIGAGNVVVRSCTGTIPSGTLLQFTISNSDSDTFLVDHADDNADCDPNASAPLVYTSSQYRCLESSSTCSKSFNTPSSGTKSKSCIRIKCTNSNSSCDLSISGKWGSATCSSHSCPTGFADKSSSIDCGASCSDSECCTPTCASYTSGCSSGQTAKSSSTTCSGTSCSSSECCETTSSSTVTCASYTTSCPSGQTAKSSSTTCSGTSCSSSECCETSSSSTSGCSSCHIDVCGKSYSNVPSGQCSNTNSYLSSNYKELYDLAQQYSKQSCLQPVVNYVCDTHLPQIDVCSKTSIAESDVDITEQVCHNVMHCGCSLSESDRDFVCNGLRGSHSSGTPTCSSSSGLSSSALTSTSSYSVYTPPSSGSSESSSSSFPIAAVAGGAGGGVLLIGGIIGYFCWKKSKASTNVGGSQVAPGDVESARLVK